MQALVQYQQGELGCAQAHLSHPLRTPMQIPYFGSRSKAMRIIVQRKLRNIIF